MPDPLGLLSTLGNGQQLAAEVGCFLKEADGTSHYEEKDAKDQDIVRPLHGELVGAELGPQTLDLQGMQQQGEESTGPCRVTLGCSCSPLEVPAFTPIFLRLIIQGHVA